VSNVDRCCARKQYDAASWLVGACGYSAAVAWAPRGLLRFGIGVLVWIGWADVDEQAVPQRDTVVYPVSSTLGQRGVVGLACLLLASTDGGASLRCSEGGGPKPNMRVAMRMTSTWLLHCRRVHQRPLQAHGQGIKPLVHASVHVDVCAANRYLQRSNGVPRGCVRGCRPRSARNATWVAPPAMPKAPCPTGSDDAPLAVLRVEATAANVGETATAVFQAMHPASESAGEATVAAFTHLLHTVHTDVGAGPPPPMLPMVLHAALSPPLPRKGVDDDAMRFAKCSVDRLRIPALEHLTQKAKRDAWSHKPHAIHRMMDDGVIQVVTHYLSSPEYDTNRPVQQRALELLLPMMGEFRFVQRISALSRLDLVNALARHLGMLDGEHSALTVMALRPLVSVAQSALAGDVDAEARRCAGAALNVLVAIASDAEKPMAAAIAAAEALHNCRNGAISFDTVTPTIPVLKRALRHAEHAGGAVEALLAISRIRDGLLGLNFGPDLLVTCGVVDDVVAAIGSGTIDAVHKHSAWAALQTVCDVSADYKWRVANSGVLRHVAPSIAADREPAGAVYFVHALHFGDDIAMLRHVLREAPDVLPALLECIAEDPTRDPHDHALACVAAMVQLAGPEEQRQLVAAGIPEDAFGAVL